MPIASSSCRQREHDVADARDDRVGEAAVVAGDDADRDADRHRDGRGDERHEQRGARAVEDAHEEVAARAVGAEPE